MDGPYEERISGRKPTRKLTSIAQSHSEQRLREQMLERETAKKKKELNSTDLEMLSFFSELLVIQYNKETQFE